jgi:hypothetical protein
MESNDNGTDPNTDCDSNSDVSDSNGSSDDENFIGVQGVNPVIGDWVAVKVLQVQGKSVSKGKTSAKMNKAFLHFAHVEDVNDDNYTVSFVKRHTDGSYYWPDIEDRSTVERDELVLIKSPSEDIASVAGARVVRVKLSFDRCDIEAARSLLDIAVTNVR